MGGDEVDGRLESVAIDGPFELRFEPNIAGVVASILVKKVFFK